MSPQNPFYTDPKLCKHLADYKLKHGLSGYNSLQNCLKTSPSGKFSIEKNNTELPICNFCNGYRTRLYYCLLCASIQCCEHAILHSRSENRHEIAVDLDRAELFCCVCSDQVYDPDFDRAVVHKYMKSIPRIKNGFDRIKVKSSKRRRLASDVESDLKKSNQMILARDRRAKSCYPLGLRGLNNLGSTCFMNSVLQALLHAPPLRNYFLSDQHNRESCEKRVSGQLCLPCDIDLIFSAVFSGDWTPYSPAQLLYSWWQHSVNLASYEQQDAHEFFISVLDGVHEEGKEKNPNKDNGDCQCIAHRAFSGLLRSDVTCMTCGFTSTTYDPCVDISLNLDSVKCLSKDENNKPLKPNKNTGKSTLLGCLDLFTRPEKLGSDQKLYCQNCRERRDSSKQMSIQRLPLVLCLHIKRFEHSPVRKLSKKLDFHLQFPFSLDMAPYLSTSIVRKRLGNRIFAFESDESEDISSEYEIFAVVTHTGILESGHYITYLRLRNQWYKCDDAWVTEVEEGTVRASQCYMVFYVQKMLYYKANEDLSCLPISLRNDTPPFFPIAGCC